jgi:hypothetical protein
MKTVCYIFSPWFFLFTLLPWRWRQNIPPKRRLTFSGLHGLIPQKIDLFRWYVYYKFYIHDYRKAVSELWMTNLFICNCSARACSKRFNDLGVFGRISSQSGYRLDGRGVGVRVPVGERSSSSRVIQTGSGAHPAPYKMGTGDTFLGNKAAEAWSWQLTPN